MAVAADILLALKADPSPKAAPAKSPQNTSDSSNDKGSNFADLYAKEKAPAPNKAPEKNQSRQADAQKKDDNNSSPAASTTTDEGSKLAEDGKPLPVEAKQAVPDEKKPDELDPLLLGLTNTPVEVEDLPLKVSEKPSVKIETDQEDAEPLVLNLPVVAPPVAAPEAAEDSPEPSAAASQPDSKQPLSAAMPLTAKLVTSDTSQAQVAEEPPASELPTTTLKASQVASDPAPKSVEPKQLDNRLAEVRPIASNLSEPVTPVTEEPLVELEVPELHTVAKPEPGNNPLSARLDALNQVVSAVQATTARPVHALVPGQPVAMEQGGWNEQLVGRVMWMSAQNLKSAEIQLDPAELGRLEVRIHLSNEQTQVNFVSASPAVRDALESQQYRLRELFNQQGMGQLEVNVSDQSGRGWQQPGEQQGTARQAELSAEEEPSMNSQEVRVQSVQGRGLVNCYV